MSGITFSFVSDNVASFKLNFSWAEAGGRSKRPNVVLFNNIKYILYDNIYFYICQNGNCINQAKVGKDKCYSCLKGKPILSRCANMIGCNTQPVFGNLDNDIRACFTHKDTWMIDIINIKCDECDKRAGYGYPGNDRKYCASHKTDSMIDLVTKSCIYPGCSVKAYFAKAGEKPLYCNTHKDSNMIDVVNKKCNYPGCSVRPTFGEEGNQPLFCFAHKELSMVDLTSSLCVYPNCNTRSSFHKLFSPTHLHCKEHSTLNEYSDRKYMPKCTVNSCCEKATFIDEYDKNIYPIRCSYHKLFTDIELLEKICVKCSDKLYFPHDKTVCMECGKYRIAELHHFKESMVKAYFQSNNIPFIHDKTIASSIIKYRPDFQIKVSFGYILVEIDENQHKPKLRKYRTQYDLPNEIDRMRNISNDILRLEGTNIQTLFIRFNPDSYLNSYNLPNMDLKQRLEYLHTILNYFMRLESINMSLGCVKLFYDNFNGQPYVENLINISFTM